MVAEIAFAVERIEDVENLLPSHLYRYLSIPRKASFLAAGIPLLTRDQRRYRQAFPGLTLISPDPGATPAR